jgi:hypothetical protein
MRRSEAGTLFSREVTLTDLCPTCVSKITLLDLVGLITPPATSATATTVTPAPIDPSKFQRP